jgi:hypothetical protein
MSLPASAQTSLRRKFCDGVLNPTANKNKIFELVPKLIDCALKRMVLEQLHLYQNSLDKNEEFIYLKNCLTPPTLTVSRLCLS